MSTDPEDYVGIGLNDEQDGRQPSNGPTFPCAYDISDPRGGFQFDSRADMLATFDNGATRDMDDGEVFHRFYDH